MERRRRFIHIAVRLQNNKLEQSENLLSDPDVILGKFLENNAGVLLFLKSESTGNDCGIVPGS